MTQSHSASDAFNDSLDFVKKLWGQMGVPGMQANGSAIPGMSTLSSMSLPSMSVEDLDQRIADLRTVENWLNMNLAMLRNTIHALEVQRATIATLQSLSSTMANTMQGFSDSVTGESEKAGDTDDQPASPLIAQSAAWWQGVQDQFKQALGAALEGAAAAGTTPSAKAGSAAAKKSPRPKATTATTAKRSGSTRTAVKSPSKRKST